MQNTINVHYAAARPGQVQGYFKSSATTTATDIKSSGAATILDLLLYLQISAAAARHTLCTTACAAFNQNLFH